jgi:signal peptidase II
MNTRKKIIVNYTVYTLIIVFGILIDQITKWLAVKFLKPIDTLPIIEDVLHFTFLRNKGAAFGMLSDQRWVFMTVSTIAILGLGIFLYMRKAPNMLYAISISAIISGGIGNMIDRIALGYVIDFIDVRLIDFAIFNVADCLVTVGAFGLIVLLLIDMVKEAKKSSGTKAEKQ